jgi:acetate---CoA ligase (ADP-forming)
VTETLNAETVNAETVNAETLNAETLNGEPDSGRRTALDRLFDPRSIAVVGASTDPGKRGHQAVRALLEAGYRYPVYPVNPRGGTVFGLRMRTAVDQLPAGVDVALVALPGRAVPGALRELAAAGVAGAVVLANGFRESGPAGAELEAELAAVVAETGIRVVGPNTSGMLNAASGANLVGVPDVPAGPVSVVTQSGNMLLSLLADDRALHGPGFHSYVGLGNQVDVRYDECLTQLAAQPGTGAIAVHAEGLVDGRAFLVAAAEASRACPVLLLRGGRSEDGRRAAVSHTGSVAGSDAVATAVLGQAGIELVQRSDELALLAGVLATTPVVPAGRGVAVLADGGGHATLAADALAGAGVGLAALGEGTRTRLRGLLGAPAAVANPVDVAGATDTDPTRFAAAADALMSDPAVGLVLVVGLFGGYHLRFDPALRTAEDATAGELVTLAARHRLPLLVQSCYTVDRPANHDILRAAGVPVLGSIDHAVRAVAALHRRGRRLATASERSSLRLPAPGPHRLTGAGVRSGVLDEPGARRLVESAGLDTGCWRLARSPAEVEAAVRELGGECAVKVVSPDVVHKSDAGGVRLRVRAEDAEGVWADITGSVHRHTPGAEITGMVVVPMAPAGVELLVGATEDPDFGPVVAFGSGGVLVEALRDVTFRAAPFTRLEALEMIGETVADRMLDGYRHLPAVDRVALADFLVRVGDLAAAHPELVELDLNPVIAEGARVLPVDVRAVLG